MTIQLKRSINATVIAISLGVLALSPSQATAQSCIVEGGCIRGPVIKGKPMPPTKQLEERLAAVSAEISTNARTNNEIGTALAKGDIAAVNSILKHNGFSEIDQYSLQFNPANFRTSGGVTTVNNPDLYGKCTIISFYQKTLPDGSSIILIKCAR